MPNTSEPERVFAALGDQTRLALLSRLSQGGPASITRLAAGFDVSRQAITKHLRLMQEAGLVESTHSGRETLWELRRDRLEEAKGFLDAVSQQWDGALERLRRHVEG